MKPQEFPERLRALLDQHGMTQKQLAKKAGFDASYVSNLCCGERYPSFENLLKIMDVFGDPYSKAYLVGA